MSGHGRNRLIDYVLLVGPSTRLPDHEVGQECGSDSDRSSGGWERIFKPQPAILRRYPLADYPEQPIGDDVAYFCQPEGCHHEIEVPTTHLFMLTHTETNVRTYGVCVSFPCLVDPVSRAQSRNWEYRNQESVSIQEWGVLSLCILSKERFFGFFEKCLQTIIHFVEHFFGDRLSWDLLIHSQFVSSSPAGKTGCYTAVRELEQWIGQLLTMSVPQPGNEVLEVELEVDPAQLLGYPDSTRLPLADFPVHQLFQYLGISTVIEVFKLLLTEQKVVLYSESYSVATQCVLTFLTLLYPLQYLFPVIPLLPSCMPAAENLLMVPTPYFFGITSSFLKKINSDMRMEIWLVDLDKDEIISPTLEDLHYQPRFPLSLLQLQADIRHAMDRLSNQDSNSPESESLERPVSSCSSEGLLLENEVDAMIRIAFLEFLIGGEMLGYVGNHLTIYRLFPRPVVALKTYSFLEQYLVGKSREEKEFIKYFIQSQSVEYYMEWYLNPPNTAFEEVQRGVSDVERLGDKLVWWQKRTKPLLVQETIYCPSREPLLYQEMLRHKASQASHGERSHESDDSDFEIVGQGYCSGGKKISYTVEDDDSSASSSPYSSPAHTSVSITQVTVEFHPPPAASPLTGLDGDTQTFLSLQSPTSSTHLQVSSSSPSLPILDFSADKTPPNHESTVFHTPPLSHATSVVANSNPLSGPFKMTNGRLGSLSPQLFHTPQSQSPSTETYSATYTDGSCVQLTTSSATPTQMGDGAAMFKTPSGILTSSEGDKSVGTGRSVPWTSLSGTYELDVHIKEITIRISTGQGLPWPKPLVFKKIIGEERSRIALLRQLELRLGLREQNDMVQCVRKEIRPVVVTKAVYRGMLELLKLITNQIEREVTNNQESPVFSAFLVFRLALSICMEGKVRTQSGHPPPSSPIGGDFLVMEEMKRKAGEECKRASLAVNGLPVSESKQFDSSHSCVTPPVRRVRAISSPVPSVGDEKEGDETKEYIYLHSDLMKSLGNGRNFMLQRSFWNNLFVCVVDSDRAYLGWNEKTAELHYRYSALSAVYRDKFGYAEDTLLSIALHNLLVFMLIVGVDKGESLDLCQRLSAKTRLATVEEKLLQQTMKDLEGSTGCVELRSLVILPLYSETQPMVTYVVHHGVSVTSPFFKLQVTNEVCILRRFPDEKITYRYWLDNMSQLSVSKEKMTLSFQYHENTGEGGREDRRGKGYFHHFHSKQYQEIYTCLQKLKC